MKKTGKNIILWLTHAQSGTEWSRECVITSFADEDVFFLT